MIKILVVDDHPLFRDGLKRIIGEVPDMQVAGEASTGQEMLAKIGKGQWDVILLDIRMPGRDGVDALRELKLSGVKIPILVLTMHSEEEYAVRALKAGASGYVTKGCASSQLIEAIRKVATGGKYVTASLAEIMARDLESNSVQFPHSSLSDREYHVLLMVASGKKLKEIAAELSLSVKTIETYRKRILEKMDMKNDVQLTRYALKHGLVQ